MGDNRASTRSSAEGFAARGRAAESAGDFGEAVSAFLDAAEAFEQSGDEDEARAYAKRVLDLWPKFEESKSLVMRAAKPKEGEAERVKRLRRLPKAGARGRVDSADEAAELLTPSVTSLPSMFIEMHAEALRLAGKERESRKRFEEARLAVEAEVARRRAEQEWSEAFSAGTSALRLALKVGGEGGVIDARRAFIALAREAAQQALTAEYFARGKHELPRQAMEAARREARVVNDEALLRSLGRETAEVDARSAELLEALANDRTAAEAILSWEDSWTYLDHRPELKRALLERPALAASLEGPFASLAGMAETHPARLEVHEFAERLSAVLAVARAAGKSEPSPGPSPR